MPEKKNNTEYIQLGSGYLYCTEFAGTIPADADIEKTENLLGYIKGGATVGYTPTYYTEQDDFALVSKTIVTKEEATLKSGIITWNGNTLAKLISTARVTETETKRTVKIGGVGNDNGKKYLIRFLHKDAKDGDVRVTIVGKNESGFSLAYIQEGGTVVDAEFKAEPHDEEGTLIQYDEEVKA